MTNKLKEYITQVLKFICLICILLLVGVVAIQVVSRQMKISLPWCEELARFSLIWLCFSGCAVAIAEKMHLSVNFFVNLAPEKIRNAIYYIDNVIIMCFFGVITYYGFALSSKTFTNFSPTMHIPMGLVYMVLPITALLTMIVILLELVDRKGEKII